MDIGDELHDPVLSSQLFMSVRRITWLLTMCSHIAWLFMPFCSNAWLLTTYSSSSRVILAFSPSTWLFNAFSGSSAVAVFSWQRAVLTYDQQTPACPLASVRICQLVMAAGGSSQLLRAQSYWQSSALPAAAE